MLSLGRRAGGQVVLTLVFVLGRRATVLARVVVLILGLRARVREGVNLSERQPERVVVLSLGRRAGGQVVLTWVFILGRRARVRGGVNLSGRELERVVV